MAQFYPALQKIKEHKVQPEPGEWQLLHFLEKTLNSSYEVYYQPYLNGDRPDVIIMRKGGGVLIVEVKDWHLDSYELDFRKRWKVKWVGAYVKSPISQVLQYKENLYDLHIEGLLEKKLKDYKYWKLVHCAVYFHNANQAEIDGFLVKPFKDDKTYQTFLKYNITLFGKNSLVSTRLAEVFDRWPLDNDSTTKQSYFSDELYKSFCRYLQPVWHALEDGKYIQYNKEQQPFIHSKPEEILIKGVAGSGKTTVLAARAVSAHKRTDSTVLILTYNVALKNYIHDKISRVREEFSWKHFRIHNYHDFFGSTMNNLEIDFHFPPDFDSYSAEQQSAYFERFYYSNESLFSAFSERIQKYSTILIDEVQDYKLPWLNIIKKYFLAPGGEYVLFGDEKQNIYNVELEQKNLKVNLADNRRQYKLKRKERFGNKIGNIANEFQKLYFRQKYNLDEGLLVEEVQLTFGGNTLYQKLEPPVRSDGIVNYIQNEIIGINAHPNDTVVLGASIELLRQLDYLYRIQTHEKTSTTFETLEIYYKIFLQKLHYDTFIQDGLALIASNKKIDSEKEDEQEVKLSSLLCIRKMLQDFPSENGTAKLNQLLTKFKVSKADFESWFTDRDLQLHLAQSKRYVTRRDLERVRNNKRNNFWFNSGVLKFSTIHSFKGWEAPNVLLLVDAAPMEKDISELIYTGITRSKSNLIVMNLGNNEYDWSLSKIFDLRKESLF